MDEINQPINTSQDVASHSISSSKNVIIIIFIAIISAVLSSVGTYMVMSQQNKQTPLPYRQSTDLPQTLPTTVMEQSPKNTLTHNPSTNWKTVSNEKIGIAFKYPDVLLPYTNNFELPSASNFGFGFNAFNNEAKRDHRALTEADLALEIVVYKLAKTSIEPYMSVIKASDDKVVTQPFPGVTGPYTKVETLTRGNIQTAIIYAEPVEEYSEYDAIILDNNKNVAIIRLMTGSHTKKQELLPLVVQIASTFEFTN